MNEIEQAMLGGFKSGDEGRPGYRTLRRRSSLKPAEISFITESGEIRQVPPVALDKAGVHPVHAEDYQFRDWT
jgi:hypothetical protein